MLTIGGTKYTLSEVVQLIRDNPDTKWRESYLCYLMKIDGSGSRSFNDYGDLIMSLAGYVMSEPEDPQKLEHYRGTWPTKNSAMVLPPIDRNDVKQEDVAAINHLMTTGNTGNGISDPSSHQTDPETGQPKKHGVTVTEYYVNGVEGRRTTKRTEQQKTTYYYSESHAFNTYQYKRLT